MVHVVYCDHTGKKGTRELDRILDGTKTMIIRGAAGRKIPHSRVDKGDTLYFMEKGSMQITAKADVNTVLNFIKLSDDEIHQKLEEFQTQLNLTEKQKLRWHKKCLCLVAFDHQGNMDDWLIIEKIEDVIVGTSIPYNYEKARFK